MNRNSTFQMYVRGLPGWKESYADTFPGRDNTRVQLGHWDVYKTGNNSSEYESWPRSCTNCLDNIWTYYKRLEKCGLLTPRGGDRGAPGGDEFPETLFDWRNLPREFIESNPIWFLKNIWGVHGKGITLIGSWDQYRQAVRDCPKEETSIEGPDVSLCGRGAVAPD